MFYCSVGVHPLAPPSISLSLSLSISHSFVCTSSSALLSDQEEEEEEDERDDKEQHKKEQKKRGRSEFSLLLLLPLTLAGVRQRRYIPPHSHDLFHRIHTCNTKIFFIFFFCLCLIASILYIEYLDNIVTNPVTTQPLRRRYNLIGSNPFHSVFLTRFIAGRDKWRCNLLMANGRDFDRQRHLPLLIPQHACSRDPLERARLSASNPARSGCWADVPGYF